MTNQKKVYSRNLEPKLIEQIDNNKTVVLTGMRRVGKTTLFKKIFNQIKSENKVWFDFDNPLDVRKFIDVDYNDVFENIITEGLSDKERIFVFIDEIQNHPEISKVIKYLSDHFNIKFFVTGSASYYLKNLFPESLAGRKVVFELFPLNFKEFLLFNNSDVNQYLKDKEKENISEVDYERFDKSYEKFVEWGGFPEVVLEKDIKRKEELLNDIFTSYFQKEIINLSDYRKINKMRELILLLAERVGSKLDISKISQEIGLHRQTIYDYISFLSSTYFINLINPFSSSVDREISGVQKIYWCDNGILKIMANLPSGHLLENSVFNQLKFYGDINYYQDKNNNELDFILNKKHIYEVKKTATESDLKKVKRIAKKIKLDSIKLVSQNFVENLDNVIYSQFL
jgi:hypothetical protein